MSLEIFFSACRFSGIKVSPTVWSKWLATHQMKCVNVRAAQAIVLNCKSLPEIYNLACSMIIWVFSLRKILSHL